MKPRNMTHRPPMQIKLETKSRDQKGKEPLVWNVVGVGANLESTTGNSNFKLGLKGCKKYPIRGSVNKNKLLLQNAVLPEEIPIRPQSYDAGMRITSGTTFIKHNSRESSPLSKKIQLDVNAQFNNGEPSLTIRMSKNESKMGSERELNKTDLSQMLPMEME